MPMGMEVKLGSQRPHHPSPLATGSTAPGSSCSTPAWVSDGQVRVPVDPARSANRNTGIRPAHDTRFGSSNVADTAAAV